MGWYMSGFSGYMKPVINPKDGVVEFRWSTIDENTRCMSYAPACLVGSQMTNFS